MKKVLVKLFVTEFIRGKNCSIFVLAITKGQCALKNAKIM